MLEPPPAAAPTEPPPASASPAHGHRAAPADRIESPSAPGAPDFLQAAVEEVARLLRTDGGMVYLLDPATGALRLTHDAGIADTAARKRMRALPLPRGAGMFWRAIETRRAVITTDYRTDASFVHSTSADELVRAVGTRSMVVAPLIAGDEVLGALGAYSHAVDQFTPSDAALVRALADHAATAIANARLIEQLGRSQAELARRVEAESALRAIGSRISQLADLNEVLQRIVDESRRLLGSDGAHLTLMDEGGRFLTPVVVAGNTEPEQRAWLTSMEFPLDGGINGLAASLGEPVWTADYMVDPRVPHEPDDQVVAERLGLRGVAVVPLRGPEGTVLGTLAVSFSRPGPVEPDAIELLQGLADQASIVLANSRLYERLRASEARYRYLVESSPDVIWQADAEGRFTYVSETSFALMGWHPEELVGRHFSTVIDERELPLVLERWTEARRDPDRPQHYRFTAKRRDGTLLPAELHARGIVVGGEFAGAHGSARDVGEQVRLEGDLREHAAQLAATEERAHLARELHDSVTQALFSMTLLTRSIELMLGTDPAAAADKLATLRVLQRDALAEMRSLIFELRPGSLAEDGLVQALRTHAAALQGRVGLPIDVIANGVQRLPIELEDSLYRIAQEALHNVVKHASATKARVRVTQADGQVTLRIEDDGDGFDPPEVAPGSLGLASMRARAEKLGGTLEVDTRPGRGTRIEVVVPLRP